MKRRKVKTTKQIPLYPIQWMEWAILLVGKYLSNLEWQNLTLQNLEEKILWRPFQESLEQNIRTNFGGTSMLWHPRCHALLTPAVRWLQCDVAWSDSLHSLWYRRCLFLCCLHFSFFLFSLQYRNNVYIYKLSVLEYIPIFQATHSVIRQIVCTLIQYYSTIVQ